MDVSIVIPMHQEVEGIPALFRALEEAHRAFSPRRAIEVILVDDGSTDGTFDAAWPRADVMPFPVKVLRIHPREGIGGALRYGFKPAIGEVILTYDADLPYPVEDMPKLVDAIDAGADVATASPYHPDGEVEDVSAFRLLLSRLASIAYRLRLGKRGGSLHTFTCGFRAYRRRVIDAVPHRSNDFLATAELLVRAIRSGFTVAEVPSVLRKRKTGSSKMRALRTTFSHLRFLMRLGKDKS